MEILTEKVDAASLAARHLPVISFDRLEPFLPEAVGYSVFQTDARSQSSAHDIRLDGATAAIEYAVWYDWDIQHLYELEHIWVYLDPQGDVLRVEASSHGAFSLALDAGGGPPLRDGRVHLHAEPGKHAFAASADRILQNRALLEERCGARAGANTVLVPDMFVRELSGLTKYDHHLARKYLRGCAFAPSYEFSHLFDLASVPLMSWAELSASIPARVQAQLARLRAADNGVKAIFLDSGDTLIDEGSQVFAEGELVLSASPIPGGDRLVAELKARGYLVALVADGLVESFENVHKALGFWDDFDARIISEEMGVTKPDPAMFTSAVAALGLTQEDHGSCVMVGNNLERDIAGANRLGMQSVWLNWTPRYPTTPANSDEVPRHTIRHPLELLGLLRKIDPPAEGTSKERFHFE